MKDFDLEKAKAGHPVCTRDGKDVRILCFDIKDDNYPICAAVITDETENIYLFTSEGKYLLSRTRHQTDLMMKTTKQERYVNIYVTKAGICTIGVTYPTKEQALKNVNNSDKYIKTVKVEWEE